MIIKDDINNFVEQTKSGVQEEIKRVKDPFKSVDALNEYYKLVEEITRMQKEAETNKILDEDGIVYFDNQPFFRESDLAKDEKSVVNHPKHYQNEGGLETIDEMILLFGLEETMIFCKLNAWKYRARASKKGSEKEDLEKANWYILKYQELEKRKL